ncbi:hypothetical protein CEP88_09955 [Roseobacter denitrificans]|uniref:Beta/gamma crystallin 'Greek key' domain-containing protein n=1 Tax=Roseobacter denitrificans (strain ATCC 33942 / OCh 114) TaxID=375451 RepID=Q160J9_ROSDO|nr:hypothetical protein [Roseobacter denitrificans]ABG33594.1 hypothetical protein RD1_4154 [Roseobacter denitrificans OCh 114]AVL52895.1 hypothetical protein CEP88_09955 [Roseobacter denitrificans]SFG03889.1 hypothetical protein SAMN05443635_10682 [Roseobacter denitrificans OCh 114]
MFRILIATGALFFLSLSASAQTVTMYDACNYSGNSYTFEVGKTDMRELIASGVGNDTVSSIKLNGAEVSVFSDAGFRGKELPIKGDIACFYHSDREWNDVISSFEVVASAAPATNLTAYSGRQCVHAVTGIGFAVTTRWYWPTDLVLNTATNELVLREGAKTYKESDVPVWQSSCVETGQKMVAQLSVLWGDELNTTVTLAAGTVVGAVGVVGSTVGCVGSAGTACPLVVGLSTVAVSATVGAVGQALPDAGGTFYLGSAENLNVWGTAWDPQTAED